ncbi:MAG: AAA family ATPase [Rhodobacterales bacterium]|nr:AAA family ATPase [Rhodobacterales bacterium]
MSQAPTPKPLDPAQLRTVCDPDQFTFETTADLPANEDVVGQDRAVEAIRFAIGMRHKGYNLFAMGPEGTGKSSLVRRFLEQRACDDPVPDDWCYVHNFDEPHRPRALRLPPGRGRALRDDMVGLVQDLVSTIPALFESDEYRDRQGIIAEQFKDQHDAAFGALQKKAAEHNVALVRTPVGLALAPIKDGEVLDQEAFGALGEDERKALAQAIEALQKDLADLLAQVPKWEKAQRAALRDLDRDVTAHAVDHLIGELVNAWSDLPAVVAHLDAVRDDVIDNVDDFRPQETPQAPPMMALAAGGDALGGTGGPGAPGGYRRYGVNVIVDNGPRGGEDTPCGAPVIYEDNPTQANLVGRIEHLAQFGAMVTDFMLIKGGALHRANGGYLILDARKLLLQPFAWETVLRALRARAVRTETPAALMGMAGMVTLEPEPIPLDTKVILLGEGWIYYELSRLDPEFRELFKVMADFDDRMDRNGESARRYAALIATLAQREGLKPLDRAAVGRVVEFGARLAGDAAKLSTHMGSIVDLVREADYWAGNAPVVGADHVKRAEEAKIRRSDRIRETLQEQILRDTMVVETQGARVGEVNGLAVLGLDHFSFGKPSRISCRVRLGKGEVIDIEREVALSGPLHSKGVLILSSYLAARFAGDGPLSLSASLVFEQSYGGVDGDSASSTELYALLSALSGIPIKQAIAVTGSVDQNGRVQAIGGANEKIEGFFDICSARGLTGDQGVMIPAANVKHLMLRDDVVAAAAEGMFHIYPVETIDQGIEILTGVAAGRPDDTGAYPIGTVNRAVAARLRALTEKALRLGRRADKPGHDHPERERSDR